MIFWNVHRTQSLVVMIGDKKFDGHRPKHAQMIGTPATDTDEKNPFHLSFSLSSEHENRATMIAPSAAQSTYRRWWLACQQLRFRRPLALQFFPLQSPCLQKRSPRRAPCDARVELSCLRQKLPLVSYNSL